MKPTRIVTLFNSSNAGAFLQAFALGCVVEGLSGIEPIYADCDARSPIREAGRRALSCLKHGDFAQARYRVRRGAAFLNALEAFPVESMQKREYESDDLLIFGSDEIWNVARSGIAKHPLLWGEGIERARCVSYAPSANGADFDSFVGRDALVKSLSRFEALSARDWETANSVSALVDRPVEVLCDPTLLLDADDYRLIQGQVPKDDYLLVYSYGSQMDAGEIAEIESFARDRHLKLISAAGWLPWCDENVPCAAPGFLTLLDGAKFVVTDTFHGAVFSAVYGKRFACYPHMKVKVSDFLERYGMADRNPHKVGSLALCLEGDVDYSRFRHVLAIERARAFDYLEGCLVSPAQEAALRKAGESGIEVRSDVDLGKMTTFKMGGVAARMWFPRKGDDLSSLPKEADGSYRVLSGGSNLLVNDGRRFSDIICMRNYDDSIQQLPDGRYEVGCSVRVQRLIKEVNAAGRGGIEELVSIPGMIGGLICMNASVPSAGVCISDHLISVKAFVDGRVVEIDRSSCGFGYRSSCFQDGMHLILSAVFAFPEQDSSESAARVSARIDRCKRLQDSSHPNCGSVFSMSSGKVMRLVKRVGMRSGKVSFSRKTPNWMINGGGTFEDAYKLIRRVERLHQVFARPCKREVVVWS